MLSLIDFCAVPANRLLCTGKYGLHFLPVGKFKTGNIQIYLLLIVAQIELAMILNKLNFNLSVRK